MEKIRNPKKMFNVVKKQRHKLLYFCCIKFLVFKRNNNIKLYREIDRKINLYSRCIGCDFKMFKTINEEEISILLKRA